MICLFYTVLFYLKFDGQDYKLLNMQWVQNVYMPKDIDSHVDMLLSTQVV